LFHRNHLPLMKTYLEEGRSPDQPGNLIAWLHPRVPVYGYQFQGLWMDIGSRQELLDADNRLRTRKGLPTRSDYSLD
jgi:NDP-sugar pyrophosphorylase family protein